MTNVVNGADMLRLMEILLIVIFLTGCSIGDTGNSTNNQNNKSQYNNEIYRDNYTIKRASNGVYLYTDRPKSSNTKNIFNTTSQS